MPLLGADMVSGTLVEWLVKPGDRVRRGDVVALVATDKGNIDVEIWQDGVIEQLVTPPDTTVPVGAVLATLRPVDGEERAAAPVAPQPIAAQTPAPPPVLAPPPPRIVPPPVAAQTARVRASPGVRRLALEHGVDLATLHGSGRAGAVTRADVEAVAVHAAPPIAAPVAADGMRRAIAAAMARSKREIPHYYVASDIEVGAALRWLAKENARRSVVERVLPAALLVKAVALAVRDFPELNGFFTDGAFRPSSAVHVGFAIAVRDGLIAPAIHDADRQPLPELMRAIADLIRRARGGGLRSSELADPTLTVTNLGEQGAQSVLGVIYPPQVAILGFGRIAERPWAENGMLGVRPVVTASLAADHRASDGYRGARFLARIAGLLAEPEKL